MTTQFKISDDLSLPLDAVTQTFAILAKRNAGKTHAASVLAEEMLKAGQPIVVYDPTGAWWGLKSSKDGKRPGFPIVVFGGEHADVPLEETAGETLAAVIVAKRIPAILDCSLMRKGARIRLMRDFCEALYLHNKQPLHFFVDEAQTIAPQNLKTMPEAAPLLGAMEDIILQGRKKGLGMTLISPRPAILNTSLRSACEVVIALQIVSSHDRKAIKEWVDVHGDDEAKAAEMMRSLSSLQREAWFWSPSWISVFKKIKFRDRETFDSSATPRVGAKLISPQQMAQVDLQALGQEIAATVEKAKADDPKELKKCILQLQKQLKEAQEKKPEPPALNSQMLQLALAEADQWWIDREAEAVTELKAARDLLTDGLKKVAGALGMLLDGERPPAPKPKAVILEKSAPVLPITPSPPVRASATVLNDLTKPQARILQALYWVRGEAITPAKVAFYADYTAGSGSFNKALGELRAMGLVQNWSVTHAGEAKCAGGPDKPTGRDLREWLRKKLSKPENAILDVLYYGYPTRLPVEELAEATGYTAGSGSFNKALGDLRKIDAIEGGAREGGVIASSVFC